MEAERQDATMATKYDRPDNRKSLIGRFRKVRKSMNGQDKRDQTPSPPLESYPTARTGAPNKLLVAQSSDSTAIDALKTPTGTAPLRSSVTKDRETKSRLKSSLPFRENVTLEKPPTAQEAAFGGPPRFDWIDIETSAAIKVQAAFRRNKVMTDMERDGVTTSAIRNRTRRRRAMKQYESSDISNLFHCCGVGLAFGDDYDANDNFAESRENSKQQYEDKRKAELEREAELRTQYRKAQIARSRAAGKTEEAYEVVE